MGSRLSGLRRLVHDAIDVITNLVEDTHEAEAKRVVEVLSHAPPAGEAAQNVDAVRKAVASLVFDSVRRVNGGVKVAGDLASDALSQLIGPDLARKAEALVEQATLGPALDGAQSALNALVGDYLAARGNELAIPMSIVHAGVPLTLQPAALAEALPHATPKLALFVHGLGCNEASWRLGAQLMYGDKEACYGRFLARDLGYTPLDVRYNTGLHISHNGRDLARLLEELAAAYPVPLEEIALIGHSMGGLVVRSAAHYAELEQRAWIGKLKHIICIGSPHLGAPLEKAGSALSKLLGMFDVAGTEVPRRVLDARSAGIKDLANGYIRDEDWTERDPDAQLKDAARDVPLVNGVRYAFVAASLLREGHALGDLVGDLLVLVPSASGKGDTTREVQFHVGHVVHGVSHLGLLNHPDVYQQLLAFLSNAVV